MRQTRLAATILMLASATAYTQEITAHRGYSSLAPENTLAAFRLAWERGADACEMDIHLTADRQIAVIHDADTKRTTGVGLVVAKTNFADLRPLDAGSWKAAAHAGERIPTLAEALATMPQGSRRFFIEIKCGPEVVPVLAEQLAPWQSRASQLCIIAFDRTAAREAKKAMPWIPVYRLSSEQTKTKMPVNLSALIRDTVEDGLDGLDLSRKWNWTPELIAEIRNAGLKIFVWTVNDPDEARLLARLGVDGITTDDPALIQQALGANP